MAKKKINIVLIIVVLALWGSVFYKTVYQYFSSKELTGQKTFASGKTEFIQINKDTFALETVARDPFLNKQTQEIVVAPKAYKPNNSATISKKITKVTPPKQVLYWPSISYHGYIKDSRGEMVLLKINSKMFRLRKNDIVEGIMIKKISSDSLELDFNTEKKTIKRFKV
jgi:hypothetical protein